MNFGVSDRFAQDGRTTRGNMAVRRDCLQQCRFAATIRPEDGRARAVGNLPVDLVQNLSCGNVDVNVTQFNRKSLSQWCLPVGCRDYILCCTDLSAPNDLDQGLVARQHGHSIVAETGQAGCMT